MFLISAKKTWETIIPKGAILKGRTGHSATYDKGTNKIFVFGGFTSAYAMITEFDLIIFDVAKESWYVLFCFNSNTVYNFHISTCLYFSNNLIKYFITVIFMNDFLNIYFKCCFPIGLSLIRI